MDNMNIDEIINYVSTNCGSSLRQTYQIKWNWTFQRKCYHLFTFLDNLMHFFGDDLAKTRIGAKRNAIWREAKYFHSNQGLILSGYVAKT